jgi:Protein of unknown function DUF262/Protein of unknown function (DUF1524)
MTKDNERQDGLPILNTFDVRALGVEHLLSGEFRFTLPWFQRAYAWPTEHVARLLGNIKEAMAAPEKARHYPLGTVMLARPPGSHETTAIVDGHQRIMTLTILFAVLRDLESDAKLKARLDALLAVPAASGAVRVHRLGPRSGPEGFIARYVQSPGATLVPLEDEIGTLSTAELAIIENRAYLAHALGPGGMTEDERRALARFVAEACWMIVQTVPDEDLAWRMLNIEEETRLSFSENDQAKATLLTAMPAEQRERAAEIWEQIEARLGAPDSFALLTHLRRLRTKRRPVVPASSELCQLFGLATNGIAFMESIYLPAAERFATLRARAVGEGVARRKIAVSLGALQAFDPQSWVPAALLWLEQRRPGKDETADFFLALERLVWLMRIGGVDPVVQENKLLRLLTEIERGVSVGRMRELAIDGKVKADALAALSGPNFFAKHYAGLVLRRLETVHGTDPGPVDRVSVTIEHVLPKRPLAKSAWRKTFTTQEMVASHANRLGNLTFLTAIDNNQKAGTLDWSAKRPIFAASGFALSKRAAAVPVWDAAAIKARTQELIRDLVAAWELPV